MDVQNDRVPGEPRFLAYLTSDQLTTLQGRVARIAEETNAAIIVCFGIRISHVFVSSSFLKASDEVRTMQCDIVILTSEKEKMKRDQIAEMVAKHNDVALRFFVLVHGVDTVDIKLKEGHPFFSTLFEKGEILSQNNPFPLPVPGQRVLTSVSSMEDYWAGRYELASHFFQAAAHASAEGWNDQAIFMLHQAVEHTCIALIKVYLGYRITSHKLSQLLSLVENFSLHSVTVFPRITPDEIRLFNLLERAYSHSRYDESYSVSAETVNALSMEVEQFLLIARALFNRKIKAESTCTDRRDVSDFVSIGLDTFARVILRQGEQEGVEIESSYGSCERILVRNEDRRLWISTGNLEPGTVYDATVFVTYKRLSGIVVHHADSCSCEQPISNERFAFVNNSSATIELDVRVNMLDVTSNRNGRILLSGFAGYGQISNSRGGEIHAEDLHLKTGRIVIKGTGNVAVTVQDELYADLNGSGNLLLTGSPRIKSLDVRGTGTLKIKNPIDYGKESE